jgi:predicted DNA-binding protein
MKNDAFISVRCPQELKDKLDLIANYFESKPSSAIRWLIEEKFEEITNV